NMFVHRLIYIGSFLSTDPPPDEKSIIEAFRRSIKLINDRYFDEKLSGFLLLYEQHFCHVLEGSEESIRRFLTLMYENEILRSQLVTVKLIAVYHHVNQRLIEDWMILTATQSPYSETDDLVEEEQSSNFYKKHCIEKLYLLGLSLRQSKMPEQHEDRPSKFLSRRRVKTTSTSASKDLVVKVSVFLPELVYIKRLLEASDVSDLKNYLEAYDKVPHLDAYEEMVWPLPCEYMPMNTFKKDIEPIGSLGTLGDI
ncbi:hypothetical protein AMK59_8268, partial [Oryctes borbonicus]